MDDASNEASLEKLFEDARMKLHLMQAEGGLENGRPGATYMRSGTANTGRAAGARDSVLSGDLLVPAAADDWDIAFVHVAEHCVIGTALSSLDASAAA
ncbi:hypothetical protein [Cupriavidus sp. SS-3]|uniref:hypothetical protein n=1 Tax=Cupriavidus sp. SS-3 TaxID=3109596 RepID=UPI002DB64A43|nr:hypothetical protein [Cupriavidus sp. SS-3]MEC3768782.1 hypothetical protein [Cupriavidus sp. SS-3]